LWKTNEEENTTEMWLVSQHYYMAMHAAQMRFLSTSVGTTRRDRVQDDEIQQLGEDNIIHEIGK
jgi:hypothetical protein